MKRGRARRRAPLRPLAASVLPGASRRRFLQLLAGASAAPWARVALPAIGLAGKAAAQTSGGEEQPPEVEPWLAIVRQRYGAGLSQEQLQQVAENLAWTARSGKTLREFALTNADAPDIVFRADLPEVRR